MSDTAPTAKQPTPVFSLSLSGAGVFGAAVFFAFSLAPSLLPRTGLFQGVVSGVTIMIGYALGVLGQWAWNYMELPVPKKGGRTQRIILWVSVGATGLLALYAMWQHVGWQNDIRTTFGQEPRGPTVWLTIVPVTAMVAALILIVARSLRKLFHLVARWLTKIMSRRAARVVGGVALLLLFWFLITGLLVDGLFNVANDVFSVRDTQTVEGITQPQSPQRSGSPESLVAWDTLGRQGRSFAGSGPTTEELNAYHGGGAKEPIRVYVGLKSAETLRQRANLVLKELIRTGAFERDVLVVATTTGTGFLEPKAMDSVEFLHNGNTAIAGVQYSYLPSWISLLADQEITRQTSRVVFDTVHDYWSTLPEESRPEVYLFGLSLGSFGVEAILRSIDVMNEPIEGGLLTGPPFVNVLWNSLTEGRDADSPAWQPEYNDGRTVRFTGLNNALGFPGAEWRDVRVVYLQHGSDPVTFFSPSMAFVEPDWMKGQRAPDVSQDMVWFPLVTMWQVALDLPVAGNVPAGYGHLYTSGEYLDGWAGISAPEGWSSIDTVLLREFLTGRDREAEAGA